MLKEKIGLQKQVKRQKRENIEVIVTCKRDTFDLSINIYPQPQCKEVKNKYFNSNLMMTNGEDFPKEPIHLELKNRRYEKGRFVHKFKRKGYFVFTIVLKAPMYMSYERFKEHEENKKNEKLTKKDLSKRLSTANISKPGFKTSNKAKFTNNNVKHPYQGGRCTPK